VFHLRTLACVLAGLGPIVAADLPVISDFDQPFLFAYLSWDKKVTVADGHAVLRGITNQGGAGFNQALDLTGIAARSPGLRLRVGQDNKAGALRVVLIDAKGSTATWTFSLAEAGSDWRLLVPSSGGDLAHPDAREKGDIDLAKITQWQLQGDWVGGKALDVEVDTLLLAAEAEVPVLAERRAKLRQAEAAAKRKAIEDLAAAKAAITHTPQSPWVENIGTVAPDVLAITIRAQDVVPGGLEPYVKQDGDTIAKEGRLTAVSRGGKRLGLLLGAQLDTLSKPEGISGDALLEPLVTDADTWSISSTSDANFATALKPTEVWRKSKPVDWAMGGDRFAMRHVVYLHLPQPLHLGAAYHLDLSHLNLRTLAQEFTYDPATTWSEAVHVNQIGFRPDDPAKRGFVSLWRGNGGKQTYAPGLAFNVIAEDGTVAYSGTLELAKAAEQTEAMGRAPRNWNNTDVWRFDFAQVTKPGTYRVSVAGVGCSYPFKIADDVWEKALLVQLQGFYNQRSGIELGPPYSEFRRPRDHHPADGAQVFQSTCSPLDVDANDEARMHGLEKGKTDTLVPEAWGGYHDAGDWNPRRITHMQNNTELLLELAVLFPAYVDRLAWPLPDQQRAPALLKEVMFEVDCFRRLQLPDGSVRFGIETNGDPRAGEVSWKSTMPMYVFAPDPWSGFIYTAMAARLAGVLERHDPTLAATYRDSALRAMTWSDAKWREIRGEPRLAKRWNISDDRNFAAIELYRLTGDTRWRDVFLEETVLTAEKPELFQWGKHIQQHAAFAYTLLPDNLADPVLKERAKQATIAMAERAMAYADGNAFNLASADRGKPMMQFFYSVPQTKDMLRAHHLTGDAKYLAAALRSTVFAAGGNPMNMTYTVGVGHDWPHHPLKLDARSTGQPAPLGQTIYGNCDFTVWTDGFHLPPWVFVHLDRISTPAARTWPIPEAYFDIFLYPGQTEYTVEGFGENAYAWGYLAARGALTP
jgi:endoglucanase